ncbi:DUF916 and DUF3324 domain-containing protein [Vagococcus fluvialis]|uniref:DUF916 and DUF3324 domain-containing protein n=1 Tax=Vagococcus fluvialis TaxID=2738 RepID=A0A7X6D9T1_9ENTE|nr:DUF916 and DUF3324 domain-containing protein [Vagococcus fluvialis]NKC68420.1 DUF916 and DUF3324 domain-containing protein [Vagococcus fluvialis]
MYKKIKGYSIRIVITTITGLLLFLALTINTYANETEKNVVGFNYKIEYPENQVKGENGYFDLLNEPGKEQIVNIELSNDGQKDVTVNLSVNGTKTNSNGVLEYGPTDIENDQSLKFPFEKLVSTQEKVEIPSGGTKKVPIKIQMPETSFDGIILGGIHMKKEDVTGDKTSQGATVRNTYSYIVAMRLQNTEKKIKPDIKFNKAKGDQRNYRNSVAINLSNTTGSLVKDKLDIETQITKRDSKEVLYERKQTGMSIAPNSQMDFYTSMGGEKMEPGNYSAHVLAIIGEDRWEETLDFKITKEEADKYNKRDVGLVQDRGLDWKIIILIVGGFLGFVIVIFIIIKRPQNRKQSRLHHSDKKVKSKKRTK